jgi:hypothetical protein
MIDIILDSNSELLANNDGDFLQDDPENNYIYRLIASNPGDWKQFPLVGVGIYSFIQSTASPEAIQQTIIKQLKGDVFTNPLVNAKKFPIISVNSVVLNAAV